MPRSTDETVRRSVADVPGEIASDALHLLIVSEDGARSVPLPTIGEVVIGRLSTCDVEIDHAQVSRKHARLHMGPAMQVTDLGSSNGTRVAGVALTPNMPAPLNPGEVVMLGSLLLVVQRASARAPRAETTAPPVGVMARLEPMLAKVAAGQISILINGETGSGKEVLASRVHALSARANKSFLSINCAALSEHLLESELFGHERGAFTGAVSSKVGLLESADGGTVFLDEIGEMPLSMQAKLLRVLEKREVLRVGALKVRAIDVRFLSATHRDLEVEVQKGNFRQDLYFRLNGVNIVLPPLRDRVDEIETLAEHFILELASHGASKRVPKLTPAALRMLMGYSWPGNIRELRNIMERALLLAGASDIDVEHLPAERMSGKRTAPAARRSEPDLFELEDPKTRRATELPAALGASSDSAFLSADDGGMERDASSGSPPVGADERERIAWALRECAGNQTSAAKLLGISRRTLVSRLADYAMPRPRARRT
jgi:two-component system, NtrC family, response regulator AtoC